MVPRLVWAAVTLLMTSPVSMETTAGLLEEDEGEFILVTEKPATGKPLTGVFSTEEYGSGSGSGSGDEPDGYSTTPSIKYTSLITGDDSTVIDVEMSTDRQTTPKTTVITDDVINVTDMTSSKNSVDVTDTGDVTATSESSDLASTVSVTGDADMTVETTSAGDDVTAEVESTTLFSGVAPVAIITADSSIIPVCTTSFSLSGSHSYSDDSSIVQHAWAVSSSGNFEKLTERLELFNAENDGRGLRDITLSQEDLGSAGTSYTFSLTVTNENDLQGVVTYDLSLSAELFTVSISTSVDTTAVDRTQGFKLRALVNFFDGCEATRDIQFDWSTNKAVVDNSLGITSSSNLNVPANTLPAALSVTFTVQACLASDTTVCARASQEVTTIRNGLQAIISGPSTRLVSVSTGELLLDGSKSNDPANLPGDLQYSWNCGSIFQGLIDGALPATTSSTITFSTSILQSEQTYTCTLTVSKDQRTASTQTIVKTTALETIDVNLEIQGDSTSVHSDEILVVKCYYDSTISVAVTWSLTSSEDSVNILSDASLLAVPIYTHNTTTGVSVSIMTLKADTLSPGGSYVTECALTTRNQEEVGRSSVKLEVYSVPTDCRLSVSDYTALTEITLVTTGCSASSLQTPLLYAYHHQKIPGGFRYQLSSPRIDNAVTIIGPDATNGSSDVTFVAEVCDQVGSCAYFSATATVQAVTMVTASEFGSFQQAHVADVASSGDSLTALQNLNSIVTTVRDTGSDAAINSSAVALLQIELLGSALAETEGDSRAVKVIADEISAISTLELEAEAKDDMANVINNLLTNADVGTDSLGVTSLASILGTTQELHSQGVEQTKVSEIEEKALDLLSRNALAGGDAVKITTPDATYTAVNTVPCGKIDLKESTAAMDTGSEICDMYSSWQCGDGAVCLGVTVQSVIYEEGMDYVSSPDDGGTLASGVLKVEFGAASTGEKIAVSGLSSEIKLLLKVPGGFSDSQSYACKYWDESTKVWSSEGVTTEVNKVTGQAECRTNHLSAFVVTSEVVTTTQQIQADPQTPSTTETSTTTQAPVRTTSALRTVMLILLGLFIFTALVIVFVYGAYLLLKRHKHKVIHTEHAVILQAMRTRREERSRSSTPRGGKVSPRPLAEEGEGDGVAKVPPCYEMEDPKVAWTKPDTEEQN